jgi:hypothetical protein
VRRNSAVFVFTLLALLVGAGAAQADLGLKALEARVGFTDLEGNAGSTFIVSAAADLGKLTPDLGLEFNVDFWNKSWGAEIVDADWTWTNIGFLANLRYMFKTHSSFHPLIFAGAGLHYWDASWDCPGCGQYFADASTNGIEFGFDVGAGAEFGSGNMIPVVRAGFNSNGGANYMFIQGGLKFPMD